MSENNYVEFCDNLFIKWNQNKLDFENNFNFELNAIPEPYLTFGETSEDLFFLTTNPGGVMDFQVKPSEFINSDEKFKDLSVRLAKHYEVILKRTPKKRIEDMYSITKMLFPKSYGFTQFEISPFHSTNFPNKERFADYVLNNISNIHRDYIDALTARLKNKNCICIQSGLPDLSRLNKKWLELISRILSVDKNEWKSISFKIKNGKATTGAFYTKKQEIFKVILFRAGSNAVPNLNSMNELFDNLIKI